MHQAFVVYPLMSSGPIVAWVIFIFLLESLTSLERFGSLEAFLCPLGDLDDDRGSMMIAVWMTRFTS